MNKESFWVFLNLGLGDAICANAIFRHYAKLHEDKMVVICCWEHNLSSIQWLLSDVPNIFFYPIETEQQLLTCKSSIAIENKLCLGFYEELLPMEKVSTDLNDWNFKAILFNPVLWDSEFYRQAGLDTELKWKGFKLPEFDKSYEEYVNSGRPCIVSHQDKERGFGFREEIIGVRINQNWALKDSCRLLHLATEIHCIDSSMLNLADLMETPYCKRFVFHRYARKGLPPQLRKPWEILD